MAQHLEKHFTVYNYDRRGRGESGDTAPYAVEREIEDLAALINEAGGSAGVFGYSSGAVLSMRAAAHGLAISKLALYEPPPTGPMAIEIAAQLARLVGEGCRGDAVELFQKQVGHPDELIVNLRNAPFRPALEKMAHTLVYEMTILTHEANPPAVSASVRVPTRVIDGGNSPEMLRNAAQAMANGIPKAQYRTLEGQTHDLAAAVLAPVAGCIDISFNAIGIPQQGIQGTPLVELLPESFALPITAYTRSHFLTAKAAARRMVEKGSGVILTLTATPARMTAPLVGGMGPAWAAVEALSRSLEAELGPQGIRVICLRPDAIPETETIREVYSLHAKGNGMTRDQFQALMEGLTLRRRLPTLAEVANVAAFMACDQANAMTGTVANLSGGSIVD